MEEQEQVEVEEQEQVEVLAGADPVPGDEPELGAVLQEHVAGGLLGVDPDPVISDDRTEEESYKLVRLLVLDRPPGGGVRLPGSGVHLELLGGVLQHGGEGGALGHAQHLEGELGVGGEGDLKGDLGGGGGHALQGIGANGPHVPGTGAGQLHRPNQENTLESRSR